MTAYPTSLGEAVAENLKRFNAKERDHLMRLAYLGSTEAYEQGREFLSPKLIALLEPHARTLGLSQPACVFAAMDYHIDWLHAALTEPTAGYADSSVDSYAMATPEPGAGKWNDFRPVIGSHEDVDLLVVFGDGCRVALLLIEAKGESDFNRPQLVRKILRLDRVVAAANARFGADVVKFRLILAAPSLPKFAGRLASATDSFSCMAHLTEPKRATPRFQRMQALLRAQSESLGTAAGFLPLTNYPKALQRLTRTGEDGTTFTRWEVTARPSRLGA